MSGLKNNLKAIADEYAAQAYPGDLAELVAPPGEVRHRPPVLRWLGAAAAIAATVAVAAWLGGGRDTVPGPEVPKAVAVGGDRPSGVQAKTTRPSMRAAKPWSTGGEARKAGNPRRSPATPLALPTDRPRPAKPSYRPRVDRGLVDWRRPLPRGLDAGWIGVSKPRRGRPQRLVSMPASRAAPKTLPKGVASSRQQQGLASTTPQNTSGSLTGRPLTSRRSKSVPPAFSPRLERASSGLSLAEGFLRNRTTQFSLRRKTHGV